MSHQRTTEDRLDAIEEVLLEVVMALRRDENEINRIRRRLKPTGTFPQPVAMVVAVKPSASPPSLPPVQASKKPLSTPAQSPPARLPQQ